MKQLRGKRAIALDLIRRDVANYGKVPSAQRLAHMMGWRTNQSAHDCFRHLVEHGYLTRLKAPAKNKAGYTFHYELSDPLFVKPKTDFIDQRFNTVV